jgi:hypothetical protein
MRLLIKPDVAKGLAKLKANLEITTRGLVRGPVSVSRRQVSVN